MHTTAFPGGLIRGQLREAETRRFDMTMLPSNEVPPVTGLAATAVSNVQAFAARDATGSINAALVVFDVNFRFPVAAVEFTGLHIHDGEAGANGPVTIDSGVSARASVTSTTGPGNITRRVRVSGGPALETVTSMFVRPEKHYLNLHTAVNPGGAVRAQLK